MSLGVLVVLALACAPLASADDRVLPREPSDEQALFADLPRVEAATLHAQTLAEAPANVSVITADEIRRYGYRTLGEALSSVRGFYMTNDHTYHYVGVRGFSLPGDFNTRFLVMLNGHPLTDNIYNSNNFFGQDFGLDMDLVERIEIIRGPTSALYGSNGMLANINVVTRSPVDSERLRASVETSSFGERKLSLSSSQNLGGGANLLVSASAFDNQGISFPLDGLALPAGVQSPVGNADGERGFHTFANLIWRNWSFTAYFNQRDKQPPVGVGTSLAGDSAQIVSDSRNLVDASYKRQAGPGRLEWRISYDEYRYHDLFDYPTDRGISRVRDINRGDWLTSQLAYSLPLGKAGPLTVGAQGNWELRNQQYNLAGGAMENLIDRPDRGVALFAQQEWDVSQRWKIYGGIRLDDTRYFQRFVSPRIAAVYQPSPQTVYKLVYGRPFRNPSTFEQFYNDGGLSYAAAPLLKPETAHALEGSFERRVAHDWTVVVNAFHYRIKQVIQAITLENNVQQYQNTDTHRSTGVELEVSAKPGKRLEVTASAVFQNAIGGGERLANAPRRISKIRLGAPVRRLFLSGDVQYLSARETWAGSTLGGAWVANATAALRFRRFDLVTGLRNVLNRRYEGPIYLTVDRLQGDGRSVFLKLVWRVWE